MRAIACIMAGLAGGAMSVGIAWPAMGATGSPPQTGCPTAWDTVSVAEWVAKGYVSAGAADDPVNRGNGDGVVCHRPLNQVQRDKFCATANCPPGAIIYYWQDNFRAEHQRTWVE